MLWVCNLISIAMVNESTKFLKDYSLNLSLLCLFVTFVSVIGSVLLLYFIF